MEMHVVKRLYKEATKRKVVDPLLWPPDVFAVACYCARVSGCYLFYSDASKTDADDITKLAETVGRRWREALEGEHPKSLLLPRELRDAWRDFGKAVNSSNSIEALVSCSKNVRRVLFLIACSDVACEGLGIPEWDGATSSPSHFEFSAQLALEQYATLCRNVSSESVRVLPKQHTPQSGCNVRSLTHHLALCNASEVVPKWNYRPLPAKVASKPVFNILLAPWPLKLNASDFEASDREVREGFGFFDFDPPEVQEIRGAAEWVKNLVGRAEKIGQNVDLLLLPECALTVTEWEDISAWCVYKKISVISGVRSASSPDAPGQNTLRAQFPIPSCPPVVQHKHHRWRLEASQIGAYGLGGTLDAKRGWWENIELKKRELNFFGLRADLVICPLICEDLARQDPVAEIVRSIGPNLVIALLMDGPQLPERWSARYATVLADDPGSSVLTLTSLGMVELSRPSGIPSRRAVACWKEASGKFISLELALQEDGLLLNLQFDGKVEWSLDGRNDDGVSSVPVLRGVHRLMA